MTENTNTYDEGQEDLAHEFAGKLVEFAQRASAFMSAHAIATAMIGTGVGVAVQGGDHETTAAWLRGIADELSASAPSVN